MTSPTEQPPPEPRDGDGAEAPEETEGPGVAARRLFAEAFGTFLLVLVSAGAPVVDS